MHGYVGVADVLPVTCPVQLLGWTDVQRAEDRAAGIDKGAIFIKIVSAATACLKPYSSVALSGGLF